jgi:antitoxin VapB
MPNTIKIQKSKGKRFVQLPDNLQLDDDRYYLKKVGNIVYLIPIHDPWSGMFDAVSDFSDDFLENRVQPDLEKRASLTP